MFIYSFNFDNVDPKANVPNQIHFAKTHQSIMFYSTANQI